MFSHCILKFSILWYLILINILIPMTYGSGDFNQIPDLPTSSKENITHSRSSDEIEAKLEPKIRQYRKVQIHVQVMTSEPEIIKGVNSGSDNTVTESAKEESGIIDKFRDNADVGPEYNLDDYFGDISILGSNISEVCKDCLRKKIENLEYHLMPAYHCDRWDDESRTCWLDRNIGGTVTFSLTFRNANETIKFPDVTWQQEFHILHRKDRIFFIITPNNLLWNTVISSGGHEFRISPISEMDVEPNRFSAFFADASAPINKVHFKIRLIPIDLGFVYPGESFIINMESYTSLPIESMAYVWYIEIDTETGILPSNMRSSPSGSVLTISELRKEQEGILSCSVFTNLGFLIAKKRFLIQQNIPEKKNSSINFKKPGTTSSSKKKKVIDQLKHDLRFQTRRRDVLSEAHKQIETALLSPQYHNTQRSFSGETFKNDHQELSENNENPYETKESGSLNNNVHLQKEHLNDRRLNQPESMTNTQQQEIIGRILSQNSPQLQQRFPFVYRKDSGKRFNKRQYQPLIAVAGSRIDFEQDPRAPYQNARQRPIPQFQPLTNVFRFYNRVSNRPNIPKTFEDRKLSYPYLNHPGIPQYDQRLNFQKNLQTRPKSISNIDRNHPDDQIAMLISECQRNTQCSSHAKCIIQSNKRGFCRCLPNYRGNGISCWEFSLELAASFF